MAVLTKGGDEGGACMYLSTAMDGKHARGLMEVSQTWLPLDKIAANTIHFCQSQVKGDAFLARVFDNEDDFKRMDFTLQVGLGAKRD